MNLSIEIILLIVALLMFCSIVMSKTSYRFGVPTLLVFLLAGMLFGVDGFGIKFDDLHAAQNIGTIALSVILFSGGMDTKVSEIKPIVPQGLVLATIGVLLTTLFCGFFVYLLSGWHWLPTVKFTFVGSLLLAATMASTDSASVFNILRTRRINLKYNIRPMLELESGSNDPMAYLLTIILIQCVSVTTGVGWGVLWMFVLQFVVGIIGGLFLGRLSVWLINRIRLKDAELYAIMMLCFVFIIYSTTFLLKGNGYLAVYIAGMIVGNSQLEKRKEIATFLNSTTWLFQIVMFLVLGLLVNPHEMLPIAFPAMLIGVFMMFVARPLSVWLCLIPFGSRVSLKSKLYVSWVGIRGAAPIIFATYPAVAKVPGGNLIFNIVFFVTLLSLLVQGMSLSWVAKKLKLVEPYIEPQNNFGIELPDDVGSTLHEIVCTETFLQKGQYLRDHLFPPGMLVIMIKRGEQYIVPNGGVEILLGDRLLLIAHNDSSSNVNC